MAQKEIKWSLRALYDKLEILEYWIDRNKSKSYSEKLNRLFDESLSFLVKHPKSGKPTDYKGIRVKIVRSYLLFYRITDEYIVVVRVWDSRDEKVKPKFY